MFIAFVGDTHLSERDRFREKLDHLYRIATDAIEMDATLMVHPGDVFDRTTTPRERLALAKWIRYVTTHMPLVIVPGNHDPDGELELYTRMLTAHPVHIVTEPKVLEFHNLGSDPAEDGDEVFYLGCMPWLSKADLMAVLPPHISSVESNIEMAKVIEAIIEEWQDQYPIGFDNSILVAHAMTEGAVMSSGDLYPNHGVQLSPNFLDRTKFGAYVFNHVHRPQKIGNRGYYIGSQCPRDFGEAGDAKRWMAADVKSGNYPVLCSFPLFNRRMVTTRFKLYEDGNWLDTELDSWFDPHDPEDIEALATELKDVETRFLLSYPADEATRAAVLADALYKGVGPHVFSIKVDMRAIPVQRTRCADIAKAETPQDKLRQWCQATGYDYSLLAGRLDNVLTLLEAK